MEEATLKQARKVLDLISQKEISGDQLQNLFESGLLSDLLEIEEPEVVDREAFRKFLGRPPLILPTLTIGVPCRELTPPYDGWELVENATSPVGSLTLQLVEFLENKEDLVKGDVMREHAKKHGFVLGEIHARALLEVQDKIPEEWRSFCLVFPGTVCRNPNGHRIVPYLIWHGDLWVLNWRWLVDGWYSDDRVVALRAPARLNDNSRSGG